MTNDRPAETGAHDGKCPVDVWTRDRWPTCYPCHKPVKGTLSDGSPACGLHIGAEKRRAANAAKLDAEEAANSARAVAMKALTDRLADVGVTATAEWSARRFGYTGRIVVSDPAALLARLEGTAPA